MSNLNFVDEKNIIKTPINNSELDFPENKLLTKLVNILHLYYSNSKILKK